MSDLRNKFDAELERIFGRVPGAAPKGAGLESFGGTAAAPALDSGGLEAIIIADEFKRPALLVRNNTYERPRSTTWRAVLDPQRSRIDKAIRSVGRVELEGHSSFDYVGTAWMIAPGIAVTNRHVASIFARKQGASGFKMLPGTNGPMKARVDFREEFRVPASFEVAVEKVLFISEPGEDQPDVALVKLASDRPLPEPIALFDGKVELERNVAVIGYPANDPRNPAAAVSDVFGSVFEVKRLSPGQVSGAPSGFRFNHDCSTLGGNSGSVVLDIETGQGMGLHFGGSFRVSNNAVTAAELKKILGKLKVQVAVPEGLEKKAKPKARSKPSSGELFDGRDGFQDDFLGKGAAVRVPLPKLGATQTADLAPVEGAKDNILRYTHFSIAMSKRRRFAFFTAVNIDGKTGVQIRRTKDKWIFDPRVAEEHQVGETLYTNNDFDRGHLVRRLDPVWGRDAEQANSDTFVYTNSTPQHKLLNEKTWNDLEDYILNNTQANDLRVNVFTGPVYAKDDPEYRGILVPQQFWKVVSVVNGETGKLHATAYVQSQKDLISDLEFVFGQFKTYQVAVADIEKRTGLSFGNLRKFDPMKEQEALPIREVISLSDIVL